MDAIVTAGGIPLPEESLYSETRGHNKALLDVAGKPMVQWVLDALSGAKTVENVIIVGLTEKSGLTCKKPVHFISNQGRMLDNFRAGVARSRELGSKSEHVLFISSDLPTITSQMVDWVVKTANESDEDIYYNVITRKVMEKRFPGSKRTYTRLKDMEVCGGDMNVARASLVLSESENSLWVKISNARKNPLKQAGLIGFNTLVPLVFHRLTLEDAIKRITQKLDITGRAILCPYAEIGMDVDKPSQLELIRKDFKKRMKSTAPAAGKKVAKPAGRATNKATGKAAKQPVKGAKKNAIKPAAKSAKQSPLKQVAKTVKTPSLKLAGKTVTKTTGKLPARPVTNTKKK